jgi:hypothetical protein
MDNYKKLVEEIFDQDTDWDMSVGEETKKKIVQAIHSAYTKGRKDRELEKVSYCPHCNRMVHAHKE